MSSAVTNGRTFEVYYRDGGHCGPFQTLYAAIRFSIRNVSGRNGHPGCVIRDRTPDRGLFDGSVAVVERSGKLSPIDCHIMDASGKHVARSSYAINMRGRRNKELRRG